MANYLYNGVELPELPKWDKTAYPYAYIVLWNSKAYYICLSDDPLEVYLGGTVINAQAAYLLSDGIWTEVSSTLNYSGVEWSNTDVYYSEDVVDLGGTLYLAASEPIPVGGEPEKPTTFTPDPISLTMGWIVGRRIAGQRGKYVEPDVPDVPDVPDDPGGTFPIQWTKTGVADNASFVLGEVTVRKVSDLMPDDEEFDGT